MLGGSIPVTRLSKVERQLLGVGAPGAFERHSEPVMMQFLPLGSQLRDDGFADPIVVGLDLVPIADGAEPDEVAGSQDGDRARLSSHPGGAVGDLGV